MSDESTAQKHDKDYRIIVNGTEKTVDKEILSFDEIVRLEFQDPVSGTIYLVTFEKAKEPKEGELLEGQSVEIKDGTEFDVTDSGRS